jgi:hypothetical protein
LLERRPWLERRNWLQRRRLLKQSAVWGAIVCVEKGAGVALTRVVVVSVVAVVEVLLASGLCEKQEKVEEDHCLPGHVGTLKHASASSFIRVICDLRMEAGLAKVTYDPDKYNI